MTKTCLNCGKEFEPKESWHKYCSAECREADERRPARSGVIKATPPPGSGPQRRRDPKPPPPGNRSQLPKDCIFDSFYEGDTLRREIFLEAADKVTGICMREGLTASQVRQLFFMLKSMDQRLKAEPDLDFGLVKQTLYEFARHVKYQVGRRVLKSPTFAALVDKELDVACKNPREFRGFVQYITSIVAYLKEK